jgi:hypothetical protein
MAGGPRLPALFRLAGRGRSLLALLALTVVSGLAMLPALSTMAAHGATLIDFESAGSVARSQEILAEWGSAGKTAMWWQLALDLPFLIGYGLLAAGACAAVAERAVAGEMPGLARAAAVFAWLGPVGAAADLLQNISLALVLGGASGQPWPRISALAGPVTTTLVALAALFAACGFAATVRRLRPARR